MNKYEEMIEFCNSESQIKLIKYLMEGNSVQEASRHFNRAATNLYRSLKSIRKRMTLTGSGEHYVSKKVVPDGLLIKGTSTLYDENGIAKIQWVKTDREAEDKLAILKEVVEEIVHDVKGIAEPVPIPLFVSQDHMTVYNIGDAHIGMLAHRDEAGDDFDLKIAKNDLIGAMERLVASSPKSKTALIIDVGDFFHADNQANETSGNGNKLDVDGRWFKVLKTGLMIMVKLVNKTLEKHEEVIIENAIGNHNEHSAIYLSLFLDSWFRNEPRVKINKNPSMFWYHQFGKVLIGVTHGHTIKPQDLGEIMACDCEELWSESKYRYWYTGHVHHDQVKEYRTYKFESFRTLASKDAWHNGQGYRSGRDMKCIVHHKDFGEVQRHTVNLAMLQKG